MERYEEALAKARAEYEKARKPGYTWLMDLLEGMFPELKESEDERIRKALIDGVRQIRCKNGITQEQMIDWLEKQKEYKPEWSEEDEAIVDCIACYLDGQFITGGTRRQCQEWFNRHRRDFLNSPHWKPSEEQMGMLLAVINDPNNAGAESCHLMLQSLYADLEKL